MPTLRSQDAPDERAKCHVISFIHDNGLGCELTVRLNNICFHIMVEETRLHSAENIRRRYMTLLSAVCDKEDQETDPAAYQKRKDLDATEAELAKSSRKVTRSLDSTLGSSPPSSDAQDISSDADSAVDVDAHDNEEGNESVSQPPDSSQDPHVELQNWILQPFGEDFQRLAPPSNEPEQLTVYDWYHPKTCFFTLEVEDGSPAPVELEVDPDYMVRIDRLIPRMKLSKQVSETSIPWLHAQDLKVLSIAHYPTPIRPGRVSVGQHEYFLKLVDTDEPAPAKREIGLLLQAEKLGLQEDIHIPKIEGMVRFGNSQSEIMGFLLTNVDDPRPLTELVDEEVDEKQRQKWAKEADRIRKTLHQREIIWGDAKPDNLLVDKHDNLWVIDFGGSYTGGWVDAELNETEEGDDMGVDKIVSALKDPADYILNAEEEADLERKSGQKTSGNQTSRKRRHSVSDEEGDVRNQKQQLKKQKT